MKGDRSVLQEKQMLKIRRHDSASPPDKMQRNADIFMTVSLPLRAKSQNRCDSTLHTSCARNKKSTHDSSFFLSISSIYGSDFHINRISYGCPSRHSKKSTVPFVGIYFTYLPTLCHHQNALVFGYQCELRGEREKNNANFPTQIHIFMAALNGNRRYYCQFSCERILFCENFNRSEKK